VVKPAMTEGPYFVDTLLNRSDIRSDASSGTVSAGALLRLVVNVSQISAAGCAPLAGALVDIWHCDAQGVYSGVDDSLTFLRGYQLSDAAGRVEFLTIYPGWYPGRAVHIHFKIRTDPDAGQGAEFTSQLFFDDAFTDQVYAQAPYAGRGQRNRLNRQDGIFGQGGEQLTLLVTPDGAGYSATFDIGVDIA
jgi:protocatechuate 3,4-dioxygenase beta subunit